MKPKVEFLWLQQVEGYCNWIPPRKCSCGLKSSDVKGDGDAPGKVPHGSQLVQLDLSSCGLNYATCYG